ncbi:outer membrane protein OmpA-like peptidoglycan-associated protein [Roseicyclus mahoneyensis]|uniref:Outer membrane protein OmpA-like peptidoglycan-associated protein n=2 Tax=Roseicyclus mahoneyensis TaxID=164332 RepID=A0A316GFL2_9RHOB|nr:outer membrane protein OmpA-like peptidoglycan-associated protein [Roseicyclus mahoneyensis]
MMRIMSLSAMINRPAALLLAASLGLAACGPGQVFDGGREVGSQIDEGGFGNPTMNNALYHTGRLQYAEVLAQRFAQEVPTTINFAFNSAELDPEARAILQQQAAFIRNFPEVRFSVYGHTDLVGSAAYNHRLGLRRARAAVHYLVSLGVERSRLDALVSLGETQPIVATEAEERRNRRTVTEVTGFVQNHPLVLDGRYAQIVYRSYAGSGSSGTE